MLKKLTLCFFLLSSCFLKAEAPDAAAAGKELKSLIKAVYVPDYDLLSKHTHDAVKELIGGEEAFLGTLKQTHEFLKKNNVEVQAIETGEKLDYFTGEENEYFFISTKMTLKIADKVQEVDGHQLAVRKKDTEIWQYIDCSALNDALLRQILPDFPKDKAIPGKK